MQISTESSIDLSNFDFSLPNELIADRPVSPRDHAKLLVYHEAQDLVEHRYFYEVANYLGSNDTIFFNNSKVFPSRLFGTKLSGGKAEVLLIEPRSIDGQYLVMLRSNGKKNMGDMYDFQGLKFTVKKNLERGLFKVTSSLSEQATLQHFFQHGLLAIPPYIRKGLSDDEDKLDYQTVFAKEEGSVAAPTAGLHFTPELFQKLNQQGVSTAEVTLHVGPGTFLPIESSNILEHKMHAEYFDFPLNVWEKLKNPKGKKIAVGTTTLRVLETGYNQYKQNGLTDIYLYPGKKVNSIDGLITNFHLPKSSLMILVSALIGVEKTQQLYQIAMEKKYRFYSYGDAMLILRNR